MASPLTYPGSTIGHEMPLGFGRRHGLLGRQSLMCSRAWSRSQCGGLDVIEFGEILVKIGFALFLNFVLVGAAAARGTFAVVGVQRVDDIHSFGDLAKGGKTHAVQARVVGEIDEQLSGARVWAGGGEGEVVFFIA